MGITEQDIKDTFKRKGKKLVVVNAKFSGKPQRACFVSSIFLKTRNSRGVKKEISRILSVQMSCSGLRVSHGAVDQRRAQGHVLWDALESVNTKARVSFSTALVRLAWSVKSSALMGVGLNVGSPLPL